MTARIRSRAEKEIGSPQEIRSGKFTDAQQAKYKNLQSLAKVG
jgi:hypothetical protein